MLTVDGTETLCVSSKPERRENRSWTISITTRRTSRPSRRLSVLRPQAFQGLVEELRNPLEYIEVSTEPLGAASTRMAETIEEVQQLSPEKRNEFFENTAA